MEGWREGGMEGGRDGGREGGRRRLRPPARQLIAWLRSDNAHFDCALRAEFHCALMTNKHENAAAIKVDWIRCGRSRLGITSFYECEVACTHTRLYARVHPQKARAAASASLTSITCARYDHRAARSCGCSGTRSHALIGRRRRGQQHLLLTQKVAVHIFGLPAFVVLVP
jgi:hypothetical protein